ncbi:MAG: gamma-glutamyl-gamma-aminobutyrate hydrolase family protein [Alphaproteobacteria bacterium]|nr:gamma-glutamyl-gamma-aminobutyrate hydrolase family protein [Alphaproteobacteria bacterium]
MDKTLITPVIGITLDSETGGPEEYSKFPWYALRQNYVAAVVRAGGLPLLLPHEMELLDIYAADLDGLLITGGAFDVDPALYSGGERHDTVTTKDHRTQFEMGLLKRAMERDIPVLGICGGQQLLHVALGGRLIQHIPDELPEALSHEQPNPRDEVSHDVEIFPDTLLADIVGETHIRVNSAHHQAARDEPQGVRINARAPDGVIEGMEAINMTFCLGVQWHPEFEITPADTRIFAAFVEAAREYAAAKARADD